MFGLEVEKEKEKKKKTQGREQQEGDYEYGSVEDDLVLVDFDALDRVSWLPDTSHDA
uniref:Putative serine protease EDA2 n=1 Tax=Rhizophora mucronata TaxID=61149 RepID=A0A2P2KJE0_RHIMU